MLPTDIGLRSDGSVLILDQNNTVRVVAPSGTISTLAGVAGKTGASGDSGLAAAATFSASQGIRVAPDGNVYLACTTDNQVRRLGPALTGFSSASDVIEFGSEDGLLVDAFDGHGRHLQTSDALTGAVLALFSYDVAGRLTTITDVDGKVTYFDRDSSGNPTAIRAPFGQKTTLTVDARNYLKTVTDPANKQTTFTYDVNGLMLTKTDANLGLSKYTYETDGRLKLDQDPALGSKTLTRADAQTGFTVTSTTALSRPSTFKTTMSADGSFSRSNRGPNGLTQSLTFAGSGSTAVAADGTKTTTKQVPDPRYGMLSPTQMVTTTLPSGLSQTHSTLRTVTQANGKVATVTETSTLNGKVWSRLFNASTRTWTTLSPLLRQSTLVLDAAGRPKDFTPGGITTRSNTFDLSGRLHLTTQGARVETLNYFSTSDTANGYLQTFTDALSNQTSYARDALGRETSETSPAPDSAVTAMGWDSLDNLISVTPPDRPAHGLNYSAVNLLSQYTPPVLASIAAPQTKYTYDLDRSLMTVTRPDGETINYVPDTAGRPSTITTSAGVITNSYYDASSCTGCAPGRLKQILNPAQGVTLGFTYDGPLPIGVSWTGNVAGSVGWTYDANFRRISEVANGTTGSVSSIAYAYDDDGLITCASAGSCSPAGAGAMTLTHDATTGMLTAAALGTVSSVLTPNAFGELATESAKVGSTSVFSEVYDSTTFPRDALGRILRKTETLQGSTTTTDYQYDTRGRLWKVFQGGSTTPARTYAYDKNGNRLSVTAGAVTTSASYDNQDRLGTYGTFTYTYTFNGELKSKTNTSPAGLTNYFYDVFGNLTEVDLPNNDVIQYVIDGQNRRVAKRKNGVIVKKWLYRDQLHPTAELNPDGTIATRFVYASGKNSPDYMIQAGGSYRILSDQLGSPRLVINTSTGAVVQTMRHDEFGNVLQDTNPGLTPFGFAGGLYDSDTGLLRFGARDYDPVVGRWISKDPILFNGGQSNIYVYARNEPINMVDPNGQGPEVVLPICAAAPAFCAAVAAGAVAAVGAIAYGISGLFDHAPSNDNSEPKTCERPLPRLSECLDACEAGPSVVGSLCARLSGPAQARCYSKVLENTQTCINWCYFEFG